MTTLHDRPQYKDFKVKQPTQYCFIVREGKLIHPDDWDGKFMSDFRHTKRLTITVNDNGEDCAVYIENGIGGGTMGGKFKEVIKNIEKECNVSFQENYFEVEQETWAKTKHLYLGYEGQYAIIQGENVYGPFATFLEANKAKFNLYPEPEWNNNTRPIMITEIWKEEPVYVQNPGFTRVK